MEKECKYEKKFYEKQTIYKENCCKCSKNCFGAWSTGNYYCKEHFIIKLKNENII